MAETGWQIPVDEGHEQFATERQAEYLRSYLKTGSIVKTADQMGVTKKQVAKCLHIIRKRAAKHGYDPTTNHRRAVPPGYAVKGTSTLYDADGNPRMQWVKSQIDREQQLQALQEAIEHLTGDITPLDPTDAPQGDHSADLMCCIPVGDHHLGQLSWHSEVGADYDTKIAERLLMKTMKFLMDSGPKAKRGAIILLGDFLHYDSIMGAFTPTNKNLLDTDSRYSRLIEAAMRSVRYAIDYALQTYQEVNVIVASGNHDPTSMIMLRQTLAALYERENRVSVDTKPRLFHYLQHGKCMIGVHHGHSAKMQDLPLIMATDEPQMWGSSQHRFIWTGHIHHHSAKDYQGATVESFRVLPPEDAHAYGSGYRSIRDMKRIDLHAEWGEAGRQSVTPQMVGE